MNLIAFIQGLNPRGSTHDDVREEAVDTAIMGIDIALTPKPGETPEQAVAAVVAMFERKLSKWDAALENGTDITLDRIESPK
jgi:hypothetical protein